MIDPNDDFSHPPPAVDGWTENYQWCGTTPSGTGFMAHVGTMPGAPHLWHTVVAVVLSDGTVLTSKSVGPAPTRAHHGTALCSFETVDPFQRWRWQADCGMRAIDPDTLATSLVTDGPTCAVRVDLTITATSQVWEPTGSDEHPEWGRFHHEQALAFDGIVTVDGVAHVLNGVGHRDHSTGVRDLRELDRAFWCNGTFPSGWAFATMWARRVNGVEFDRAAIWADGTWNDQTLSDVPVVGDAAANPRRCSFIIGRRRVDVEVLGGATFTVAGKTEWCIGTEPTWPECYLLTHRLARLTCDGETGLGFIDRGAGVRFVTGGQP